MFFFFLNTRTVIILNVLIFINILLNWIAQQNTVGSRFMRGLRSRIFGRKSNRHKMSAI